MFDLSIWELSLIAIVAVVVIGPSELPRALATAGRWVNKARGIMGNFRTGLDAMVRESELQEMEQKWAAENERIMREHPAPEALGSDSGEETKADRKQDAGKNDAPEPSSTDIKAADAEGKTKPSVEPDAS